MAAEWGLLYGVAVSWRRLGSEWMSHCITGGSVLHLGPLNGGSKAKMINKHFITLQVRLCDRKHQHQYIPKKITIRNTCGY